MQLTACKIINIFKLQHQLTVILIKRLSAPAAESDLEVIF